MPYDPNNPNPPYVDNNFRVIPRNQPSFDTDGSINDLDNPLFRQGLLTGEDSAQIEQRLNEQVTNAIMQSYEANRKSVLDKVLFYPESLGNVTARTYVDGHEAPRHSLKITILNYAGGNLVSKETKAAANSASANFSGSMKDFGNLEIGSGFSKLGSSIGAAYETVGSQLSNPEFYANESNNIQNRAASLSQPGMNPSAMINAAIKEGASETQKSAVQDQVKKFLNSNQGRDFATNYLTAESNKSAENLLIQSGLSDKIASKTAINSAVLPEGIESIIYLYATTENLNFQYTTKWNIQETSGAISDMQNIISNAMTQNNAGDAFKTLGYGLLESVGRSTLNVLAQAGEGGGLGAAATSALAKSGLAPAQNFEFLFDSVERRNFTVNVSFQPKSKYEVETVAKIIAAFKYYGLPSRPDNSPLLKVPCYFLLENLTYVENKGWIENLYLPKYKVCVLQNTSVKYDNNGSLITHAEYTTTNVGATYKAPIKIDLNLSFTEIQILTREDVPNPKEFFSGNLKNGHY